MVRQFTAAEVEPQANEFNAKEQCNIPLLKKLGELGLHGICIEEEYGGTNFDATAVCIAMEELSYSDPGFCLAYLAHSLLFTHNLGINGNEAQKSKYLPDCVSGAKIGCMGMSEPGAGTDVLGLKTSAVKKGDNYVINGSKMWITNGCLDDTTLGDLALVYARTGEGRRDISLFLVEKGTPGFKLGQRIKEKCGMRASPTAELVFEDVEVPAENLVGGLNEGLIAMMRNLEIERVALAAMSLGMARRCIAEMTKYANERETFGSPLTSYGQIQRHIGESFAEYQAGRAFVYDLCQRLDLHSQTGARCDSDATKLYCSTMAKNVADRAIQSMGGYGYVGEYHVERMWRDSKLIEIGGGTLEAHQKNIANDLCKLGFDTVCPE